MVDSGLSYFGEPNLGNERSSRRGKKSNSDKPRQPQRGLGVAQLEKIRLHSQMGCTYLPPPSLHSPNYPTNLNQEDMRLQTPYSSLPSSSASFSYTTSSSSSSSYGFHGQQNIMMGLGDLERPNMGYADSHPRTTTRWNPGNDMLVTQQFAQPSMDRHFLNQQVENSLQNKRKKDRSDSIGSGSQNSETSDTQELDLELRLSL
ncbi:Protein SPEAR1 [Camellia lanceoleosa]|uniref:Protein SPEAR1 n=1 Tax=Camellia lanceoleosa TaxID=1840588 RepID=A0ACC0FLD6_9ERIC|nr:Protein SPEAR1 [Camellia lanceoleosa]